MACSSCDKKYAVIECAFISAAMRTRTGFPGGEDEEASDLRHVLGRLYISEIHPCPILKYALLRLYPGQIRAATDFCRAP